MDTCLYWEAAAEAIISRLIRPERGDPLLILTNTAHDLSLPEACLAAGMRSGADTHLMIKPRRERGHTGKLGPAIAAAIQASKLILDLGDEIDADPATI